MGVIPCFLFDNFPKYEEDHKKFIDKKMKSPVFEYLKECKDDLRICLSKIYNNCSIEFTLGPERPEPVDPSTTGQADDGGGGGAR